MASAGSPVDTMREDAESCLRALAGPSARLREDQWTAIQALVTQRRRALVVQRTGWGKSAVYFVTTALLRARGMGPTIIVSPLLALMRNQIEAASAAGLQARTVNSANIGDWDGIYAEIAAGAVNLLLVSPERLNNPRLPGSDRCPSWPPPPGCWSSTRPTASPTGAMTSAPIPPAAHPAAGPAAGRAGAGHHGHGQRAGHPRRRRAAGYRCRRRGARAPRPAGPGQPVPRGGPAAYRRAAPRLARRAPGRAPRLGHHLHADRGRGARDRGVPARPGPRRRAVHRPGSSRPSGWPRSGPARR